MKAKILLSAPSSGSGKTMLARGIMAILKSKGFIVQPFKCGPDYIDTKFHEAVCGRPSINLDSFMASPEHVKKIFMQYGEDADVCVVEGMMGLFDGYDRSKGSTADIARLLDIPVTLVIDPSSAAYSVAPVIQGFVNFDPNVKIQGVIFNKVKSPRHEKLLRQVCADLSVQCFGCVPKSSLFENASRYLGLDFSMQDKSNYNEFVEFIDNYVDWKNMTGL